MNTKRYITASLVVFVVTYILDWVIHSLILGGTYNNYPDFFVAGIGGIAVFYAIIKSLIFGFVFCFIFTKGYEEKGILEGVRYGLWIGLLLWLPLMFSSWNTFQFTKVIPFWWLILGVIQIIILGIITAAIYKPAKVEEPKPEEPKIE